MTDFDIIYSRETLSSLGMGPEGKQPALERLLRPHADAR
jgi:hypothetical protein